MWTDEDTQAVKGQFMPYIHLGCSAESCLFVEILVIEILVFSRFITGVNGILFMTIKAIRKYI